MPTENQREIAGMVFDVEADVVLIPIELITPDTNQPRKFFNPNTLGNLTNGIRKLGQQTPITVRLLKKPIRKAIFMIIAGERRYRACVNAKNIKFIRAIILDVGDDPDQIEELQIQENASRDDLCLLDMCAVIKRRIDAGRTVDEITKLCGKSITWVNQHLDLLRLHPSALKYLSETVEEEKQISYTTALLLLKVKRELQPEIARQISEKGMTYSEAKNLIPRAIFEKTGQTGIADPESEFASMQKFVHKINKWIEGYFTFDESQLREILRGGTAADRQEIFRKLEVLGNKFPRLATYLRDIPIRPKKK